MRLTKLIKIRLIKSQSFDIYNAQIYMSMPCASSKCIFSQKLTQIQHDAICKNGHSIDDKYPPRKGTFGLLFPQIRFSLS